MDQDDRTRNDGHIDDLRVNGLTSTHVLATTTYFVIRLAGRHTLESLGASERLEVLLPSSFRQMDALPFDVPRPESAWMPPGPFYWLRPIQPVHASQGVLGNRVS